MWVQKVLKVGDSLGVVVPAPVRRELQINRGDFVVVVLNSENQLYIHKIDEAMAKSLLEKEIQYGK